MRLNRCDRVIYLSRQLGPLYRHQTVYRLASLDGDKEMERIVRGDGLVECDRLRKRAKHLLQFFAMLRVRFELLRLYGLAFRLDIGEERRRIARKRREGRIEFAVE